jgi:hypothetical protein
MISPFLLYPGTNLLVAGKTLQVGNFFPQFVAFGTVGQPIEMGMKLRQITGRQLS